MEQQIDHLHHKRQEYVYTEGHEFVEQHKFKSFDANPYQTLERQRTGTLQLRSSSDRSFEKPKAYNIMESKRDSFNTITLKKLNKLNNHSFDKTLPEKRRIGSTDRTLSTKVGL